MTKFDNSKKIANDWGWELKKLLEYLEEPDSNPVMNLSASQTASQILKYLLKDE